MEEPGIVPFLASSKSSILGGRSLRPHRNQHFIKPISSVSAAARLRLTPGPGVPHCSGQAIVFELEQQGRDHEIDKESRHSGRSGHYVGCPDGWSIRGRGQRHSIRRNGLCGQRVRRLPRGVHRLRGARRYCIPRVHDAVRQLPPGGQLEVRAHRDGPVHGSHMGRRPDVTRPSQRRACRSGAILHPGGHTVDNATHAQLLLGPHVQDDRERQR
jgi:hypothetical protein